MMNEEIDTALGLRERKKAKLRQQIFKTAVALFRERGFEQTRIDDIVNALDISQPTFFRYFPSKEEILREVGRRAYAHIAALLRDELLRDASTADRLQRLYLTLAREVEGDRALWHAMAVTGAMDPVHTPGQRENEESTTALLREILAEGQKRGEITRAFPVVHLAEFVDGMYGAVVHHWLTDLTGPHFLSERVSAAVAFFLRGARP